MGFMTMPASQDLSPHSCASAMAPRSQSCHAVGARDTGLENGEDYSDTQSQHGGRCPPTKPKRHPSTRLSSSDPRAPHVLPDTPPPPLPTHSQKSDSGDMSKKVPPLKPKRSPSTQLSFDPPPARVPPPATPLPFQGGEGKPQGEEGDDEPVYIEMVGQVFTRESQTATPHPVTPVATTPDSDSDQNEAIYEEMKYPLPEDREGHKRIPLKHERLKSSKHHSSGISAPLPRPSSSPSCSKPKSTSKIPAPFPNLLQHRPPLLAFPQPAAASSGVGVQHKAVAAKLGTINSQLDPAPGLRARSHSTPLPPSSKSTSPYSHQHHHPHHRPSHYHHYRKPDRGDSPNPNTNNKNGSETSSKSTAQTQTQGSGKEGKSVSFYLKSDKGDRDRDRERDRERERDVSSVTILSIDNHCMFTQQFPSVIPLSEDEGRAWNGSADALLRVDKEELVPGHRGRGGGGGHSGIPVRFTGGRGLGHSESLAGMEEGFLGFRALPRGGLPLPCQTFPAYRNGELGRFGRSSSTSGARQVGGCDVQRQSSLPHREALSQPPNTGGAAASAAQTQRDGKLLEVIERKRCLCKEIKAQRRPDKSLCKQDSMPILPSWRRTPEPRKTGTPPCQRPQAVVWDTAI
uniref:Neuronal tyrosine-phosphorylated phosphoinositide-3-kinase adapter N-terminal domain-containing protein n=1 Tax=Oncorhynchus mykiss TaxID=8022 RepID=A0A8K9UT20_ONCMY